MICNEKDNYRFGLNAQEKVNEVNGIGNHNTALFWEYDTRLGRRWNIDPKEVVGFSLYSVFQNNPISKNDVNGDIPFPLKDKFKNWGWRIDSWFGPRNTGLAGASKFHKGLDFNYAGGGNTDYGAPILSTHDGNAVIDNSTAGGEGRSVTITSPDGKFRTIYMHMSKINIENGLVKEGQEIGEFGGSANGKEDGRTVHLHYTIQKFNDQTGKWDQFDPTEGRGKDKKYIVDPQKWINSDEESEDSNPKSSTDGSISGRREYFKPGPPRSRIQKIGDWIQKNTIKGSGGNDIGKWLSK